MFYLWTDIDNVRVCMCGIVAGVAHRDVIPILLEGLKRLEYRGYDSSGVALVDEDRQIHRVRALGKIQDLADRIKSSQSELFGRLGIAHTRWATHGMPCENNAHPHICNHTIAVVHNGIIENYQSLASSQKADGYRFTSQTDTEVVAHEVHAGYQGDLLASVQKAAGALEGAYALAVIASDDPNTLVAARRGSPLVIGVGVEEFFVASDVSALLPVTNQFVFLEDGDFARLTVSGFEVFDAQGVPVSREMKTSSLSALDMELGDHRHYMHKEIHEQPQAVMNTLEGRVTADSVVVSAFGQQAEAWFEQIEAVQILACGTSFHAGMVAKYWFEDIVGLPCAVEVASEFRYRNPVVSDKTLVVALSQSGETADTLAAFDSLKMKQNNLGISLFYLTICNVPESSLTRVSDSVFLMHAGPEIGVASTKAFTSQLVALALLMSSVGKVKSVLSPERERLIVHGLKQLPRLIEQSLSYEEDIKQLAYEFADKSNALFLGRGTMYPIAMEGALKLKEISYIHAEAYPAGELKHGPLALVDECLPIVSVAPNDELLDKLKSNLQEVHARGGHLFVFEDVSSHVNTHDEAFTVLKVASNVGRVTAPITFNIALQLLAYYVALVKGTDVDQPRNLAKSVTVE